MISLRLLSRSGRAALTCCAIAAIAACRHAPPEAVLANDNRVPAGAYRDGVLTVRLEVRAGYWHPEGEGGIGIVTPMFAEAGRPPQDPGPLIRVPAGTRMSIHVRNALRSDTVAIHGLQDHRGGSERPIVLLPGAARDVTFDASAPGTYFYWATTSGKSLEERAGYDGQLNGAFIVDPQGAESSRPDDRVLIISHWSSDGDPRRPAPGEAWTLNGRSWPATERMSYPVKQPIRWRLINASYESHPMHLHGTYFRVDSLSVAGGTVKLAAADQSLVATNVIPTGQGQTLTWTPGKPGNWLFHCHIVFHVDPLLRMTPRAGPHADHASESALDHMAGLVLGIQVEADPGDTPGDPPSRARELTLQIGERPGVKYSNPLEPIVSWPGLGYRVVDPSHAVAAPPFSAPGPLLVLTRGEPVAIAIENHLSTATSVHWHGIELDSYYDGVSGWGGVGSQRTPAIAPGGTFVARFTPPRSGTFMYHTHLNDYEQLSTGLYGAIVVVEPGERFDPEVDKVLVLSRGGPDDEKDPVWINGSATPPPVELSAGVPYRFRLIGITPAPAVTVSIRDGDRTLSWRPVAKDGAALAGVRPLQPAKQSVSPGETYDFVFTPSARGPLELQAHLFGAIQTAMALRVK